MKEVLVGPRMFTSLKSNMDRDQRVANTVSSNSGSKTTLWATEIAW